MESVLLGFVGVFPYLLVVMALLFVFKVIHDWVTPYDDDKQVRSGNLAVGLTRGSMYVGLTIAMCGLLFSEQLDLFLDLGAFALEGLMAVLIMTGASFVFDLVILPRIDNRKEVEKGNLAVALVESAAYVGLGFIMLTSLAGGGAPTLWRDILSGLLFSALGLVTLMGVYLVFGLIYKALRGHKVSEEIAGGNVAMAIEAGGVILAMSVVLGFSIIGDFRGWWIDILSYLVAAVAGVLAVVLAQVISRYLFIRGSTLREDGTHAANTASACINGCLLVSFGIVSGLVTFV